MTLGEELTALLRGAPLIDGHNDLLWELREQVAYDFEALDISRPSTTTQTDLPRLSRGGVGAQFWSVFVPSDLPGHEAVTATLEQLDGFHRMLARYPGLLGLAVNADQVEAVARGGRIASLAGVEGGHSIGDSLGALRMLYALGARYLTLTHNDNTSWADSATDEPVHGGLTEFGRDVVRELNRLGMLVDLSHVAEPTMHAALDTTVAPVIFSHSSARALCDHPRNVPDAVLERLSSEGGVCMVTFVPGFISQAVADVWRESDALERQWQAELGADEPAKAEVKRRAAAWAEAHPAPSVTVSEVADHVDHIREVAGVEHLGIGGDYDGVEWQPVGLDDVSCYPTLFAELRSRGYSDSDLRAIAGQNVLRVMRAAESVAG